MLYGGKSEFSLKCERTNSLLFFNCFYDSKSKTFQKTGQYPSIADLHISKVKDYAKVLGKEKLKEFTRAIGLAANGVGIGSFVYLRRIFEDLIEEAHLLAKTENDWDEEEYGKSRMAEKIGLLHSHLPEFLVENKTLYGILSKGIHSLEENECLAYFETVKAGIELILDEKVEIEQKKAKLEAAKAKISQLQQSLSAKQN